MFFLNFRRINNAFALEVMCKGNNLLDMGQLLEEAKAKYINL